MAVLHIKFESQYLGSRHPVTIVLPDTPRTMEPKEFFGNGQKYPVLWLLHGTFGDCDDWLHRSMIEVFACENNLAVVMPNGLNTDYVNWPKAGIGTNAYEYLFEELMPMVYNWLPVSDKREDNYIAGLSMGGMGAMSYALGHPEKFSVAASLSYPLMPAEYELVLNPGDKLVGTPPHLKRFRPNRKENQIENAGGIEAYKASVANTWDRLIDAKSAGADLPKLYFCIGKKDFLYPAWIQFRSMIEEKGFDVVLEEEDGYGHEWRFWNMYIERFIKRYVKSVPIDGLPF